MRATCGIIGVTLIVLLWAERVGPRERDIADLSVGQGLLIGAAQAVALIPGVSRSGATISAGLFLGLDRVSAARFSFLLSIPSVVLSGLFELKGLIDGTTTGPTPALGVTALAMATAFVVGYTSIALLLRFLTTRSTGVFIAYRIALGTLVLALVAAGTI